VDADRELKATAGVLITGLWLQLVAWAVCATLTAWLCSDFYGAALARRPRGGTRLAIWPTRRVRPFTDVVLTSVAVGLILTAPFAFATFMLDAGRLGADPAHQYPNALALYEWHAVDVLPFVNATDTLRWNQPVDGYSTTTGVLLLLYKGSRPRAGRAAARAAWRGRETP
jgi:hypothetical protein